MATSDIHIGSSVRALANDPNGPLGRTSGGVPPDGASPTGRPFMPKDGSMPGDPYEDSPPVVDTETPFNTPFSAPPGT